MNKQWGIDLRLLRNLDYQNDRDRGRDLSTIQRPETGKVDLEEQSGGDNLKQALLLRFLTQIGELAPLGHPNYGSQLFELIGELNNETNRNRAKMYVLKALQAEPRVKEVQYIRVTQSRADPTRMDIEVQLLPIDSNTPLNFVFPFFLEGGATP
ncbi:MAG: hypothetical protein BA864_09470 [Desulfuromonadales bacterium C00003093]|nr:MAG: hypothetical protein BA864_09470 [Desulfuromonadales bacterium C00003093]